MKDFYSTKAKIEGYRARAAYKLKQINNKYHLIKEGYKVLDIGCFPGSWSQVALEIVKDKGFVLGIDMRKVKKIKSRNFSFIQGDITKKGIEKKINGKFNTVISDVSPKTTGIINLDQELIHDLAGVSLNISLKKLKPEGNFLVKIFQSNKTNELVRETKKHFKFVKMIKPESSKSKSKEMYIIAKGKN